jgi:hypothetical protein
MPRKNIPISIPIHARVSSDESSSEEDEKKVDLSSESESEEEPEPEWYINKKGKLVKRRKRKNPPKPKVKKEKQIIFEEDTKDLNEWELDIPLYSHQQNSVLKMEHQEQNPTRTCTYKGGIGEIKSDITSHVGILSDKVGSGKTLTTVSFLARRKKHEVMEYTENQNEINKIYIKNNIKFINIHNPFSVSQKTWFSYTKYCSQTYFYIPVNLIVIGASVYNQWIDELKHSNLSFKVIYKNADIDDIEKWMDQVDVILITYNRYNDFYKRFYSKYLLHYSSRNGVNHYNYSGVYFRRIIFDEVQVYGKLETLYALNYWIISATVQCAYDPIIYNRYTRSNMMADILSSTIGNFINIKNTPEELQQSYQQAEMIQHYYNCYVRDLNNLMSHINPEIQRMLAADDLAGAIASLGGNKDNKSIVEIVIEKEEAIIKEIKAKIVYHTSMEHDDKIKEFNEKLEKAEKSLQNLKEKLQNSEEECPICCCDFEGKDKILTDCCKYVMCNDCVSNLYKTTKKCPFCRNIMDLSKMVVSSSKHCNNENDEKEQKEEYEPKSKSETVVEIIKSKPNGKFLLFSEYSSTFENITQALNQNNISWSEVKGTTDTKQKHIKDYKNGKTRVLFLNARSDGTGTNLPETTDIILYHQLSSSAIETQIFGRALRLGRTAPLVVHRLLSQAERRIQSNDPTQIIHVQSQQINQADNNNNYDSDNESEEEIDERLRQEQEDHRLALELQRQLNFEN